MGFVDQLKKLFGSQPGRQPDQGLYIYVKLERTGEVVRLRLSPQHELNSDEAGGYVSHKSIIGPRTFGRAEATFRFDERRALVDTEITGGTLATREEWLEQHPEDAVSQ